MIFNGNLKFAADGFGRGCASSALFLQALPGAMIKKNRLSLQK